MKRIAQPFATLSACLLIALAAPAWAQEKKGDPTGTWTWTTPGRDGQPRTSTLKLKAEGDKLTGTISGRGGETAISDGKLKGDQVSFVVTREFNGNKVTIKYAGKFSGDSIKGKSETERDGQTQSRDWDAKRGEAK